MKRTHIISLILAAVTLLSACHRSTSPEDSTLSDPFASHTTEAQTDTPPESDPIPSETTLSPAPYDPETSAPTVFVTYLSDEGGTVRGNLAQTLTDNRLTCTKVMAIADPGYRFIGWSDGSTDPVRSGDSFAVDTVITACFAQDILNLPAVSLTMEADPDRMDTDYYVDGCISIAGCDEEYELDHLATEIRGRGHGSWTYEKKGWKLKLSESQSLLGLGDGRSREWVLLANHIDRSLLRNAAATWIQQRLELPWVADYAFVDLYLNGEYMGVYQLYEQIEEDEHKIPITPGTVEDVSYFVELTVHADTYRFTVHSTPYEVCSNLPDTENPRAYVEAIDAHLTACLVAVKSGDYDAITRLIDLDSAVNAYIVEELTKNRDTGWDSFYLYRNPGGKLVFGPVWDFDMSSGNVKADDSSVCRHTFQYPDGLYAGNLAAAGDRQQNPWFMALAKQDWFWELVETRWQEVYPSLTGLPDLLRRTGDLYEDAFERNFERWDILHERLSTEAPVILTMDSCSEQISYLADWYRQRISWLNGQWGAE
ncbi:MAG: CotH kinase family protein [Clostridia bacterium]|nr:CotH kinase family protein [Clostridia bacterium]